MCVLRACGWEDQGGLRVGWCGRGLNRCRSRPSASQVPPAVFTGVTGQMEYLREQFNCASPTLGLVGC